MGQEAGRRASQLIVVLALAFLALLVVLSVLPEPAPEATLPPSPTPAAPPSPPAPTPTPLPRLRESENADVELKIQLQDQDHELQGGEFVEARMFITNNTTETIYLEGYWLTLIGKEGMVENAWHGPATPDVQDNSTDFTMAPGVALTIRSFKRMPETQEAEQTYELWGTVGYAFTDPALTTPENRSTPRQIDAGGFPLRVRPAPPERQLKTEISTDVKGWSLRITTRDGAPLKEQPWAALSVETQRGNMYFGEARRAHDGVVEGRWSEFAYDAQTEGLVRLSVLVNGPGYVSASSTVDLAPALSAAEAGGQGYETQTFEQLGEALEAYGKRALSIPNGSLGLRFVRARVGVRRWTNEDQQHERRDLQQTYDVDGAGALVMEQAPGELTVEQLMRFYQGEELAVGGRPGYVLSKRYGWWTLAWSRDGMFVSLSAAERILSREQLLEIVPLVE